jgi:hypothetical protein
MEAIVTRRKRSIRQTTFTEKNDRPEGGSSAKAKRKTQR